MYSRHYRKVRIFFALADSLLVLMAFFAAYFLRRVLPFDRSFELDGPVQALLACGAIVLWITLAYWLEVYDRLDSAHPAVILRDSFRQCMFGAIGLVLLQYLTRLDLSRSFTLLLVIFSWVLLCVFRLMAGHLVGHIRREFGATHYVLVIGSGDRARRIEQLLEGSEKFGIRLLDVIDEDVAFVEVPLILRRNIIDEIIFAVDSSKLPGLEELFLLCDEEGVRTRVSVDFFPHVHSQVFLDRLGSAPLLTFSAAPHDEIRLLLKRITDIFLAAAAMVVLLPFMLFIVLLIKITSPGPAVFRQVRCGLNGRKFVFYKFRSMVDNADEMKSELEHLNQKQTAFKIPNDPRMTAIGRWLRKFSIDELPQFWNVLKGDMSLVGPRPAVPEEVDRYQRWQRRRLRMRPGLTCLWALNGRDHLDFDTWMRLDMQYIDNWSLTLDFKILLKTVPQVLLGKGAN